MGEAVELATMISQLRRELVEAARAGEGEEFGFALGPVELELSVAVAKEAGPNAKVKFWVVEVGADAKRSSTSTQKIKLVLDPRRFAEPDKRPVISGQAVTGER